MFRHYSIFWKSQIYRTQRNILQYFHLPIWLSVDCSGHSSDHPPILYISSVNYTLMSTAPAILPSICQHFRWLLFLPFFWVLCLPIEMCWTSFSWALVSWKWLELTSSSLGLKHLFFAPSFSLLFPPCPCQPGEPYCFNQNKSQVSAKSTSKATPKFCFKLLCISLMIMGTVFSSFAWCDLTCLWPYIVWGQSPRTI